MRRIMEREKSKKEDYSNPMGIPLTEIIQALKTYSRMFEGSTVQSLQPLLEAVQPACDITACTHMPRHVTTSAVIFDENKRVLHIRHKILNRWLRGNPGTGMPISGLSFAWSLLGRLQSGRKK